MATAEDLMRILAVIQESNELSRAQMKDLSEAIAKKGSAGKKWSNIERYKHITSFNGKPEVWEEWHTKVKGEMTDSRPASGFWKRATTHIG